ncbi:UvrD-helicase domain-containing protein [Streptomyces otsuchiensis]|uniref:UvrD-helicase domain-containing protein n=1 Tax=Streptomyces otsuchiensis TaxID=2681388 RepID=UPI0014771084|nr:UvrD-helicase domain-containing protein [Streptomyces otsuchiensis]
MTLEQVGAAASSGPLVYVEASPGSGKTTVSTQRFGLHRFAPTTDHRAVVAVSFTRSATEELRGRVVRQWGTTALAWPHRAVTLDALLNELLSHLLRSGVLVWPGGHQELVVLDKWQTHLATISTRRKPVLRLDGARVVTDVSYQPKSHSHPDSADFTVAVEGGTCTHDNVREVLDSALRPGGAARRAAVSWLERTTRSLLVDEVYDANDLDLEFIRLATEANVAVTLVGDHWQALYGFRGAQPNQVADLIEQLEFATRPLHTSFRWLTSSQEALAGALRARQGVALPVGRSAGADVVLARQWRTLWNAGCPVLPLAIKPRVGRFQEAACTLLLNELTLAAFGQPAIYLSDARITLGEAGDSDVLTELRPRLQATLDRLAGEEDLAGIWSDVVETIATGTRSELPQAKLPVPRMALDWLRSRLDVARGPLVPGMTCHQAKGREWNRVGVKLLDEDIAALRGGLDPADEEHRALYVALTRARLQTVAV